MQDKFSYAHIILKAQKLISEGIVIIDASKVNLPILFINKGFKKITGYKSNELIGKGYKLFQNEKSTHTNIKKFNDSFLERKNVTTDLYLKKSNDQFCYCRISISYIPDKSNNYGYFLLVVRDITEIRKAMINEMKLDVVNATLRSVNDIVLNYMQGLLLFRTDCEAYCTSPKVRFELFDKQYNVTLKNLTKLNQMREYKERRIGGGSSNIVILAPE
jgi:PAS domain S-box-containing protein